MCHFSQPNSRCPTVLLLGIATEWESNGHWSSQNDHTQRYPDLRCMETRLPSCNQTWQWKMDHLSSFINDFPIKPPFMGICQPAMFDYQRVFRMLMSNSVTYLEYRPYHQDRSDWKGKIHIFRELWRQIEAHSFVIRWISMVYGGYPHLEAP